MFGLLLLLPGAAAVMLFIAYPVVYSFLLTFSDFTVREQRWFAAGFDNYREVLNDRGFRRSFVFTVTYAALYVPLSVGFALLVGVLLQQVKIGASFFRSVLFLPTVVPLTMGFLMFQWVLDPRFGILNYLLRDVLMVPGLALNWLGSRDTVTGTLIAISLWGFGPWILLLARLLSIPRELYDAARVDGATHVQEFWHITLPQLKAMLMVVTTLEVIKALKVFVPIYVLTSGGPANHTRSLYFLSFQRIGEFKLAYATTVGWVFTLLVVLLAGVTSLVFRVRREDG